MAFEDNEKAIYEAIDSRENLPEYEDDTLLPFEPYHDNPNYEPKQESKALPPLPGTDEYNEEDSKSWIAKNIRVVRIVVLTAIFTICPLFVLGVLIQTEAFGKDFQLPGFPSKGGCHGGKLEPVGKDGKYPVENGNINFLSAYPYFELKGLEPAEERKCRLAWESLKNIPCHTGIFIRNFDEGFFSLSGPEIREVASKICPAGDQCREALDNAYNVVSDACPVDKNSFTWSTKGYNGEFTVDKLESTPKEVVKTLVDRYARTCSTNKEGKFCMVELENQWGFIDGYKTDGKAGLDRFMTNTDRGFFNQFGKGGPRRNSTDCTECLLDFFGRQLKTVELDDLPNGLRKLERAGRRCKGPKFGEMYKVAIQEYEAKGLLKDGWEDTQDFQELVNHGGPGPQTYPIKQIRETVELFRPWAGNEPEAKTAFELFAREYINCLSIFEMLVQDLPCYPYMGFSNIKKYILNTTETAANGCSPKCLDMTDDIRQPMHQFCPTIRNGKWKGYDEKIEQFGVEIQPGETQLPFSFDMIFNENTGLTTIYEVSCRKANPHSRSGPVCGAVFNKFGKPNWVLERPWRQQTVPYYLDLMETISKELDNLPPMDSTTLTNMKWVNGLEEGVCGDCVWRLFVNPKGHWAKQLIPGKEFTMDERIQWLRLVHRLQDTCHERGKKGHPEELHEVDEAFRRVWEIKYWIEAFPDTVSSTETKDEMIKK